MKNQTNLKSIEIKGLFSKKNIKLPFENLVNILISENGAGKTSILNILVGLLTNNVELLKEINFESVVLEFSNKIYKISKKEIVSSRYNLDEFYREVANILERRGKRELVQQMFELIDKNLDPIDVIRELKQEISPIVYKKIRYMHERYLDDYDDFFGLDKRNKGIHKILEVKDMFGMCVEYFPTYRRIEKENVKNYFSQEYSGINFGMKDVEKRINSLTKEIKNETLKDFLEMNNEILVDVIEGKASKKNVSSEEIKSISSVIPIVLQRIKNSDIEEKQTEIVEKVTALLKNPPKEESKFLPYYLWKMFNIYKKQELKEKRINSFIDVCNKYLNNKQFNYSAEDTNVEIRDENGKIIKLSYLSSGEKQIVSLFAKLYLEEKENLMIVIDEPELSISMKWQKMLLLDIVDSGKCDLLLVTTHSPFIFHNKFDIYAEDLNNYISLFVKEEENE